MVATSILLKWASAEDDTDATSPVIKWRGFGEGRILALWVTKAALLANKEATKKQIILDVERFIVAVLMLL